MRHTDFMALAGKMWGELGADDKAPFEAEAEAGKQRYAKELAEWKEHGCYTRPDGTKSGPAKDKSELDGLSDDDDVSLADDGPSRKAVGKHRAETMAKQAVASAKGSRAGSRGPSASNTPKQSKTRPSAGN